MGGILICSSLVASAASLSGRESILLKQAVTLEEVLEQTSEHACFVTQGPFVTGASYPPTLVGHVG